MRARAAGVLGDTNDHGKEESFTFINFDFNYFRKQLNTFESIA